jgi:hypothetical protein
MFGEPIGMTAEEEKLYETFAMQLMEAYETVPAAEFTKIMESLFEQAVAAGQNSEVVLKCVYAGLWAHNKRIAAE